MLLLHTVILSGKGSRSQSRIYMKLHCSNSPWATAENVTGESEGSARSLVGSEAVAAVATVNDASSENIEAWSRRSGVETQDRRYIYVWGCTMRAAQPDGQARLRCRAGCNARQSFQWNVGGLTTDYLDRHEVVRVVESIGPYLEKDRSDLDGSQLMRGWCDIRWTVG